MLWPERYYNDEYDDVLNVDPFPYLANELYSRTVSTGRDAEGSDVGTSSSDDGSDVEDDFHLHDLVT